MKPTGLLTISTHLLPPSALPPLQQVFCFLEKELGNEFYHDYSSNKEKQKPIRFYAKENTLVFLTEKDIHELSVIVQSDDKDILRGLTHFLEEAFEENLVETVTTVFYNTNTLYRSKKDV